MIKFDPALLTIDVVQLKSVTTALGGSITVVDEVKSTPGKEVTRRMKVPMAVTRHFLQHTHKRTKYLKPVYTALVKYGTLVVGMESHPLSSMGELISDGVFGPTRWIPKCEANIKDVIKPLIEQSDRDWFFDGRYAYSFDGGSTNEAVRNGEHLTQDGSFRKVIANTLDLQNLSGVKQVKADERSCLAFVTAQGAGVISPPIWKNLSEVGATQMSKAGATPDEDGEDDDDESSDVPNNIKYSFDKIDETLSVNLNFALKAGKEIGGTFGYDRVEALRLPQLMVELCTVNLPNIPASVKATYCIGLKFTHTICWLLGMSRSAHTLENYMVVRSLMKHLTKKGIFRKNVFSAERIFKGAQTVDNVPFLKLDELLANQDFNKQSLSSLLALARSSGKARKDDGIHSVDTLLNDE
jgi:hypothetical protein